MFSGSVEKISTKRLNRRLEIFLWFPCHFIKKSSFLLVLRSLPVFIYSYCNFFDFGYGINRTQNFSKWIIVAAIVSKQFVHNSIPFSNKLTKTYYKGENSIHSCDNMTQAWLISIVKAMRLGYYISTTPNCRQNSFQASCIRTSNWGFSKLQLIS